MATGPDLNFTWTTPVGGYKSLNDTALTVAAYKLTMDNGVDDWIIPGNGSLNNYTIPNFDLLYTGTHAFKIAAAQDLGADRLGPYSDIVNFNIEYYNQPTGVSATQVGGDVRLDWQYPTNDWSFRSGNNVAFKYIRHNQNFGAFPYGNQNIGAYNYTIGAESAGPWLQDINGQLTTNRNEWQSFVGTSGFSYLSSSWNYNNGASASLPSGGYLLRLVNQTPIPLNQDYIRQYIALRAEHTLEMSCQVYMPDLSGGSIICDFVLFNSSTTVVIKSTTITASPVTITLSNYDVSSSYDYLGIRFRNTSSNNYAIYVDNILYQVYAPYVNYGTAGRSFDYGVARFGDNNYGYQIAALNTANNYQYIYSSSTATVSIVNNNIPSAVTGSTSGNAINLSWTNPTYTVPVASFAINRFTLPSGPGTLLNFNNNGSANTYSDTNIGFTPGTYKYQISACEYTDGFGAYGYSAFSPNIGITYQAPSSPITYELTGNVTLLKYYGSYDMQLEWQTTGGPGTITAETFEFRENTNGSTSGASTLSARYTYSISPNGGTLTQVHTTVDRQAAGQTRYIYGAGVFNNPSVVNRDDANYILSRSSVASTYHVTPLQANPYTVGTFRDVKIVLPIKVTPSTLSASIVGANVNLSWSVVTDSNVTTPYNWGYLIAKYNNDYSVRTNIWVAGNATTTYTDIAPGGGTWRYYLLAASFDGTSNPSKYSLSYYVSQASNEANVTISVSSPITYELTGDVTLLKYYGSYDMQLEWRTTGGPGTITAETFEFLENTDGSTSGAAARYVYEISPNGSTLTQVHTTVDRQASGQTRYIYGSIAFNIPAVINRDDANYILSRGSVASTYHVTPLQISPYTVGTFRDVKFVLPIKVTPATLSAVYGSGGNVDLYWSVVTDSNVTTPYNWGYLIAKYNNDYSFRTNIWVAGNASTAYTDITPGNGTWRYYLYAASFDGTLDPSKYSLSYYLSEASNEASITISGFIFE